jgi:hypothetical protein
MLEQGDCALGECRGREVPVVRFATEQDVAERAADDVGRRTGRP